MQYRKFLTWLYNFDIFELYFSTTSCSKPFLVRKNNIVSEACNSGRFKWFKKSMMISTINAPYRIHLFPSDDCRATVAGDGLVRASTRQSITHKIRTSLLWTRICVLFALLAKIRMRFLYERRDEFGLLIHQQYSINVTSFQNHLMALPS